MDNNSFSLSGGPITEEEKLLTIEGGLRWEDSKGEIFDVSTDVESLNASWNSMNHSQLSLALFEETEKFYSSPKPKVGVVGDLNSNKDQTASPGPLKVKEVNTLPVVNLSVNNCSLEEDEDKENKIIVAETPLDSGKGVRVSLKEAGRATNSPAVLNVSYEISQEESMNEGGVDLIPCTQNLSFGVDGDADAEGSKVYEECDEIVPCTQVQEIPEGSFYESMSQLDVSSVPCSQASLTSVASFDPDDTITTMTKLLALAEEQEAEEKRLADVETETEGIATSNKNMVEAQKPSSTTNSPAAKNPQARSSDSGTFKTPLKHLRVLKLKGKNMCTPSPPRHHVDNLLQRKTTGTLIAQKPIKLGVNSDSPSSTSTPKRQPLANITPSKKPATANAEGATSTPPRKTPVAAKVDSGLRRQSPIGLSPVANYIYSKPAPSTFTRVPGIASHSKPAPISALPRPVTKIPVPPSRTFQAQAKPQTPGSASKPRSVLKTSTFFNLNSTPPQIISNEKSDIKRFQPLQYTGAAKVKAVNGRVESPRDGYVAHRHVGLRDDSGNASFVQNTFIQKHNIPHQSRFVTPKSVSKSK